VVGGAAGVVGAGGFGGGTGALVPMTAAVNGIPPFMLNLYQAAATCPGPC
jgi:hypothetical protein